MSLELPVSLGAPTPNESFEVFDVSSCMAVPGSLGLAMKELDAAEERTREVKGFKLILEIAHLNLHSFDFNFFRFLPAVSFSQPVHIREVAPVRGVGHKAKQSHTSF